MEILGNNCDEILMKFERSIEERIFGPTSQIISKM
jgi:hypothetical protein